MFSRLLEEWRAARDGVLFCPLPCRRLIAMLLVVSWILPVPDVPALERSALVAVKVADGSPYFLGKLNGELYYKLQSHLWKTDGIPAGTTLLTTAEPLGPHLDNFPPGCFPFCSKHYPAGESAGGLFFFAADDGVHGSELWRSDGTPAGTHVAKDIDTAPFDPTSLVSVSNVMFFSRGYPSCSPQCELWRSDGTEAGTFSLTALPTPGFLLAAGVSGLLLFENGNDLWSSDGTVLGTAVLETGATFLVGIEGKLFFTSATHLWATDGTVGGAVQLTNFPVSLHGCVGGACYFSEVTATGNEGIWKTDGTPGGTLKLAPLGASSLGGQFVDVNGTVYFTNGDQLWKTNGTPAGTQVVDNVFPQQLTSAYGELFFISSGQLWRSDGTAVGTTVVTDFGVDHTLAAIIALNGGLLLKVDGPSCGGFGSPCVRDWRLYTSDGTPAGTQPVADFAESVFLCPTPLCSASFLTPPTSIVVDGKWFFEALDSVSHAPRLWMATHVFFRDVGPDQWAFSWVERAAELGITGGCHPEHYCPDDSVTRGQMAVFLERGLHGSGFTPPPGSGSIFADVPASHWAVNWIEQLYADGLSGGCGISPLVYCPESVVTRAQLAVLLLRAKNGPSYVPPPVGSSTGFNDVPTAHWAAAWIVQLAAEHITGGCGGGDYCPDRAVTRAELAVLLLKAFPPPP
jgi:ELWxxDGT repeat protein